MSLRSRPSMSSMGDDEADTDVDKAIAQMLWKNHRLFPPTSVFKNNWDSVMLAFVFYNCIFVPVELCFAYAADSKVRLRRAFWGEGAGVGAGRVVR